MSDKGVRVFLKDGTFQDYDPVEESDLQYEDGKVLIWGNDYHEEKYVKEIHSYIREDKKINGLYIRVFTTKSALRYISDKVIGETDDQN